MVLGVIMMLVGSLALYLTEPEIPEEAQPNSYAEIIAGSDSVEPIPELDASPVLPEPPVESISNQDDQSTDQSETPIAVSKFAIIFTLLLASVVAKLMGFLMLGLYGGVTQFSCDLYANNCPFKDIKKRFLRFNVYTQHLAWVLASFGSQILLLPHTVFFCAVVQSCLLFKLRSIDH
jgi:hypothetical protein